MNPAWQAPRLRATAENQRRAGRRCAMMFA